MITYSLFFCFFFFDDKKEMLNFADLKFDGTLKT